MPASNRLTHGEEFEAPSVARQLPGFWGGLLDFLETVSGDSGDGRTDLATLRGGPDALPRDRFQIAGGY